MLNRKFKWVNKYDPEVLVIAPCGFEISRTMEEMHLLSGKMGWEGLRAVKGGQVFIADFNLFTQSSAGTLVDGIELLAGIYHPQVIDVPVRLRDKLASYEKQKVL